MPTAQDPLGVNDNENEEQNQPQAQNTGGGPQKYDNYVVPEKDEGDENDAKQEEKGFKSAMRKISFIIPGFIAIVVIALIVIFWLSRENTNVLNTDDIPGQEITQEDFERLAGEQAQIDSTNKKLIVTADAEFNGTLQVKQDLDLAGDLNVGGSLSFAELSVSGLGTFGELAVGSDAAVQGSLAVQNSLTVSGNANISGSASVAGNLTAASITTGDLSFTGAIQISQHITTAGGSATASRGNAVGSSGTVSVSGTDTAGTAQANTGTNPSSGSLVTVNFSTEYTSVPSVLITPVGSDTASLNYYVSRSTNGFTIFAKNVAAPSANYTFDYFVIE